jgi:hypothetical protein
MKLNLTTFFANCRDKSKRKWLEKKPKTGAIYIDEDLLSDLYIVADCENTKARYIIEGIMETFINNVVNLRSNKDGTTNPG